MYARSENRRQKTKNEKQKIAKMMVFHKARGKQLVYCEPDKKLAIVYHQPDRKLASLSSASQKTTVQ